MSSRVFSHISHRTVVRGEVTVVVAQALQVIVQQGEVLRFLECHPHPVAVEVRRHPGKAPDGVQREVDGVELDVADRVDQCGAACHGERRALRHQRGRNQVRLRRSTRQAGRLRDVVVRY
jgi:hypothetical protein